jgi:hypothetical protein
LAAALTLFNAWVLIAEFVIDRYGIDNHPPFYVKMAALRSIIRGH